MVLRFFVVSALRRSIPERPGTGSGGKSRLSLPMQRRGVFAGVFHPANPRTSTGLVVRWGKEVLGP